MKEPKKTKVVIEDLVGKIQDVIDSEIKINPNTLIWEYEREKLLKNCEWVLRELNVIPSVSEFAEALVKELISNRYIYTRINTEGLNDKIEKIAKETLEDWFFTQEQYDWLEANNLSFTEEYL